MQMKIHITHRHNLNKSAGFSMLEILITLVIISIGLFGMVGMRTLSLNNIGTAHSSSEASMLADSLASSINANKAYWGGSENGLPNGITPVDSVNISGKNLDPAITAAYTDCSSGVTCTAKQMAAFDLTNWGSELAKALPDGKGKVVCTKNTNVTIGQALYLCVITVSWNEKNIRSLSDSNTKSSPAAYTAKTYTMVVQQ